MTAADPGNVNAAFETAVLCNGVSYGQNKGVEKT